MARRIARRNVFLPPETRADLLQTQRYPILPHARAIFARGYQILHAAASGRLYALPFFPEADVLPSHGILFFSPAVYFTIDECLHNRPCPYTLKPVTNFLRALRLKKFYRKVRKEGAKQAKDLWKPFREKNRQSAKSGEFYV